MVFFLGSLRYIDDEIEADQVHLAVILGGMLSFLLGAFLVRVISREYGQDAERWISKPVDTIGSGGAISLYVYAIIVVSVAVCIMYQMSVGFNLLFEGMVSIFSGQGRIEDAATLRLEFYGGEEYFAPGYVNQFKNILLPLMVLFLLARKVILKNSGRIHGLFIAILMFVSLYFLLMTGQRAPVFWIGAIAVVYFLVVLPRKKAVKYSVAVVGIFTVSFLALTLILGRGGIGSLEGADDYLELFLQLPERLFSINQASGVYGFRYIYERPVQYGADWVAQLQILLPGKGGITIDNELNALFTGTTRGTAPPSIWGSIWYNFGLLGAIIVPFILGIVYQNTYYRLIRGPKTLFRTLAFTFFFVSLGTWGVGGPFWLVNNGLLAVVLLILFERIWVGFNDRITARA